MKAKKLRLFCRTQGITLLVLIIVFCSSLAFKSSYAWGDRVLSVPFIHQVLDTEQYDFNGSAACAPTSGVMVLAYHNRLLEYDGGYAYYVCNVYPDGFDYKGQHFTQQASYDDSCGHHEGQGAWGYIWEYRSNIRENLSCYLRCHDLSITFVPSPSKTETENIVKYEIDHNRPVIAYTRLFSSCGHFIVIKGYKHISGTMKYAVNDPFGEKGSSCNNGDCSCKGYSDGSNAVYTYEEMNLTDTQGPSKGLLIVKPTQLQVGNNVVVRDFRLKVRESPSSSGNLLRIKDVGSVGTIINGPVYNDEHIWWKIDWHDGDAAGWSAQDPLESALPDLTISASLPKTDFKPGEQVQIPVTVIRTGGNLTRGTYVLARLYWSDDSNLDSGDTLLWESNGSTPDYPIRYLNDHAAKTVIATTHPIPSGSPGQHYIIAIVDPDGYHEESNESNNMTVYSVFLSSSGDTLSVSLTADHSSGNAPLDVTLTADVSGTATGTINYTFWWNCNDPGTSVGDVMNVCGYIPTPSPGSCASNENGIKCDGVTNDPKIVSHTYSSPGTYTAKVIAERGSADPAEDRITITVNSPLPPSPTNVQASDGTYTDRVRVTWNSVSSATSYKVYRATSSGGTKTYLGSTSSTTYDDYSASVGTTYYYWVKAKNAYGESGYSSYDTGYRKGVAPPSPTNVQASDGTYTDKVRVTWNSVSSATSYKVYRATSSGGTKTYLGSTSSTTYDDYSASVGTTYYYWVKAKNAYGESGYSSYDTGYRKGTSTHKPMPWLHLLLEE